MDLFLKILVCFIAGAGAGLGTGFAGMSAAAVISPLLSTFLGIPIYQAIGIGLASDVLASAASAYTYHKNKNLDIKNSLTLIVTVLLATVFGSFVASHLPEQAMDGTAQIVMIFIGLKFILFPARTTGAAMKDQSTLSRVIRSIVGGIIVGFICGFVGAGGGMMLLFVLTSFLGYELHHAVGTSVFIMAFTALTGSISHFVIDTSPDVVALILCIVFTLLWAQIAARIANHAKSETLSRVVGAVLVLTGLVVLFVNYLLPVLRSL